jgi:hypothetical protein
MRHEAVGTILFRASFRSVMQHSALHDSTTCRPAGFDARAHGAIWVAEPPEEKPR